MEEDLCPSMLSIFCAVLIAMDKVAYTAMMQLDLMISCLTEFRVQEANWELPFLITNSTDTITLSNNYQMMYKR